MNFVSFDQMETILQTIGGRLDNMNVDTDDLTEEQMTAALDIIRPSNVFVDLGLSSGTKWAAYNVGASSVEQPGNYYAMGEPYTKNVYPARGLMKISSRIFYAGDVQPITYGNVPEYCQSWSVNLTDEEVRAMKMTTADEIRAKGVMEGSVIRDRYDPAYVVGVRGEKGYMPSAAQVDELIKGTTQEVIAVRGVTCVKFTSNSNDNYIIIPCAGSMNGGLLYPDGAATSGSADPGFGIIYKDGYMENDPTSPGRIAAKLYTLKVSSSGIVHNHRAYFGYGTIGLPVRAVSHK